MCSSPISPLTLNVDIIPLFPRRTHSPAQWVAPHNCDLTHKLPTRWPQHGQKYRERCREKRFWRAEDMEQESTGVKALSWAGISCALCTQRLLLLETPGAAHPAQPHCHAALLLLPHAHRLLPLALLEHRVVQALQGHVPQPQVLHLHQPRQHGVPAQLLGQPAAKQGLAKCDRRRSDRQRARL